MLKQRILTRILYLLNIYTYTIYVTSLYTNTSTSFVSVHIGSTQMFCLYYSFDTKKDRMTFVSIWSLNGRHNISISFHDTFSYRIRCLSLILRTRRCLFVSSMSVDSNFVQTAAFVANIVMTWDAILQFQISYLIKKW